MWVRDINDGTTYSCIDSGYLMLMLTWYFPLSVILSPSSDLSGSTLLQSCQSFALNRTHQSPIIRQSVSTAFRGTHTCINVTTGRLRSLQERHQEPEGPLWARTSFQVIQASRLWCRCSIEGYRCIPREGCGSTLCNDNATPAPSYWSFLSVFFFLRVLSICFRNTTNRSHPLNKQLKKSIKNFKLFNLHWRISNLLVHSMNWQLQMLLKLDLKSLKLLKKWSRMENGPLLDMERRWVEHKSSGGRESEHFLLLESPIPFSPLSILSRAERSLSRAFSKLCIYWCMVATWPSSFLQFGNLQAL